MARRTLNAETTVKSLNLILILSLGMSFAARAQAPAPMDPEQQKKALELLHRTILSRERQAAGIGASLTNQLANDPSLTEMEQQYLAGKISAKQFQKFLQDHKIEMNQVPPAADTHARALQVLRQMNGPAPAAPAPAAAKVAPATAKVAPAATEPPVNSGFPDVEAKMDELIRLKEARDKAATNSTASPTPKTKRERMDQLLRQLIQGKISDADYKTQREKLLAEPE